MADETTGLLTAAEREAIREAALLLDEAEANEVKERHRTAIADTFATLRALLDRATTTGEGVSHA